MFPLRITLSIVNVAAAFIQIAPPFSLTTLLLTHPLIKLMSVIFKLTAVGTTKCLVTCDASKIVFTDVTPCNVMFCTFGHVNPLFPIPVTVPAYT